MSTLVIDRKLLLHTTELLRECIEHCVIKHEQAVMEIMVEQRAEIERLRALVTEYSNRITSELTPRSSGCGLRTSDCTTRSSGSEAN